MQAYWILPFFTNDIHSNVFVFQGTSHTPGISSLHSGLTQGTIQTGGYMSKTAGLADKVRKIDNYVEFYQS